MVIWIIGMSGAGKSTIGRRVYELIKNDQPNTVLIDGDTIRDIFKHDDFKTDYSLEQRKKNAQRITQLCKWLDSQGINVICCILSIFEDLRCKNNELFSSYFEVYISAPIEFLKKYRDYRGIYAQADKGQLKDVVGIDIKFPEPKSSDLVIVNTEERKDFTNLAREIINNANQKFILKGG